MTPEMIDRIREVLVPLNPAAVYLFGSAATGRTRPESDLDLAILPTDEVAASRILETSIQLAEVLGRDIDLVDLSRSNAVLRKEVLANGRLLYETDRRRRAEFEMYALSDYARLNEERAPVLAVLGQALPPDA